jgi:hypothetical protein
MKLSTRYQARGIFRIIRGTTRKIAGTILSKRMMGTKGSLDCLTGKLQRKLGKVQGVFGL